MMMRGILVVVACAVGMGGCGECEEGETRSCVFWDSACDRAEQTCESGEWGTCDCIDWCDTDASSDAPDDPAPDPKDAADIPADPDDLDTEDVEDEG